MSSSAESIKPLNDSMLFTDLLTLGATYLLRKAWHYDDVVYRSNVQET